MSLTADEIMSSHIVFGKNDETLFRQLVRKWHPDTNKDPRASDVMARINSLYTSAKTGKYSKTLVVELGVGQCDYYHYLHMQATELGELYICPRNVIWAIRPEFKDLAGQFTAMVRAFKFPTEDMRKEFVDYLPGATLILHGADRHYILFERSQEVIRLADLLRVKGPVELNHAAWMISSLHNMVCWLEWSGIRHHDLSIETYFVNPATHQGALLGGWSYAGVGDRNLRVRAAPERTTKTLSQHKSLSDTQLHLAQVKIIAKKLLGITSVGQLRARKDIPDPLKRWLESGPEEDAIQAYRRWHEILVEALGPRKFTVYDLTGRDIYGEM